jgi:hypothetical protein
MPLSLVIIHDLYVLRPRRCPAEAYPELVVHTYAILPGTLTLERFQSIPWWDSQIFKPSGDLQLAKLSPSNSLDLLEPPDAFPTRESLRIGTPKRQKHGRIITLCVNHVKHYC